MMYSKSYDDNVVTLNFPNGDIGEITRFPQYSTFSYSDGAYWELHSGITKTLADAETLLLACAESYGAFSGEIWE